MVTLLTEGHMRLNHDDVLTCVDFHCVFNLNQSPILPLSELDGPPVRLLLPCLFRRQSCDALA